MNRSSILLLFMMMALIVSLAGISFAGEADIAGAAEEEKLSRIAVGGVVTDGSTGQTLPGRYHTRERYDVWYFLGG
jgi:hypothetical protein